MATEQKQKHSLFLLPLLLFLEVRIFLLLLLQQQQQQQQQQHHHHHQLLGDSGGERNTFTLETQRTPLMLK